MSRPRCFGLVTSGELVNNGLALTGLKRRYVVVPDINSRKDELYQGKPSDFDSAVDEVSKTKRKNLKNFLAQLR